MATTTTVLCSVALWNLTTPQNEAAYVSWLEHWPDARVHVGWQPVHIRYGTSEEERARLKKKHDENERHRRERAWEELVEWEFRVRQQQRQRKEQEERTAQGLPPTPWEWESTEGQGSMFHGRVPGLRTIGVPPEYKTFAEAMEWDRKLQKQERAQRLLEEHQRRHLQQQRQHYCPLSPQMKAVGAVTTIGAVGAAGAWTYVRVAPFMYRAFQWFRRMSRR